MQSYNFFFIYTIDAKIFFGEDFYKPKIVWASVGAIEYSIIPKEYFLLDTNYFFSIETSIELLAILNSKLLYWWISKEDTPIGTGGAYRHYKYNLERIAIPYISEQIKNNLNELIKQILNENKNIEQIQNEINNLVYKLYNLTEQEIIEIERF